MDFQQLIERFAAKDAEVALDRERDRLIVDARDSDVDDDDIAILANFENLVDLNLAGSKVTKVSMEHIVNFARLEYLDLGRTKCEEGCIVYLPALTALRGVGLSGIRLGDEAWHLSQLRALDVFYLENTSVPKQIVREIIQRTIVTVMDLVGNGFQPDDFWDLDMLEDDSRTVVLDLGDGVRLGIARPPANRS